MIKKPFHPVLFGLFPAVTLLARNVSQVEISDTIRVFFVCLTLTAIVWYCAHLIVRNWPKAGLLSSLALVLFFTYGHVFSVLKGFTLGSLLIGRTAILAPAFVLGMLFGSWYILMRVVDTGGITRATNMLGVILLAYPLGVVASYHIEARMIGDTRPIEISTELTQQFQDEVPDIYYIILDMHARGDVLEAIYGYDLSWFTDSLEDLGFYVAYESTSNYSSTLQSLTSSLNMEYINYLQDTYGRDARNREPLRQLLAQNNVTRILKELGYKTGAFQTGAVFTEFRSADIYIKLTPEQIRRYQNFWTLNSFEGIFLQTTLARIPYDLGLLSLGKVIKQTIETPYQIHRLTILNILEHLPDFALQNENYFVFAHIIAPHQPFVFGPNGEELEHSEPFSLAGPGRQDAGPKYIDLYINQLDFIDQLILEAIEKILVSSKTDPIIILQADHGPIGYTGENLVEGVNMKEQHGILSAYYFPDGRYESLYPSVSPVNSFRIMLNTFFGANYELLPDKNFFIPYAPYDFIDVTDRVEADQLAP